MISKKSLNYIEPLQQCEGFFFVYLNMDIENANKFLENFEKIKLELTDRDKILYYSINLLKITHDIYEYLINSRFNFLSESPEKLSLEEAIIKANLIRIKHYIHSIIILSENFSNIETLQVLQRVHYESCINLIYITKEKGVVKDRVSSYMKKSLKDLKEILNKELRPNESIDKEGQPNIANRIENQFKKY